MKLFLAPFVVRRVLTTVFFGIACLTGFFAQAHYCGPPVIRCKPGDIISYYVVSDRAEQGFSGFSVFSQTHPEVAPVVYYTSIGRVYGLYMIQAQQVGTNQIAAYWNFPPNGNSGFCVFEVRVSTNIITTAGNNPWSAYAGDPVNTYTGELVTEEPPDLFLGGPMPLYFSRYYASRLQADALLNSRMGNNWSHNFEWRSYLMLTNQAIVVSPKGLAVHFNKSGTNWVLQSPTHMPFQLTDNGTNFVFGDPRDNRLYNFNTNGLLTSISDGKGNTHTLTYTNELLTQVSDGLGRTLTFDYEGAHSLSSVSDGTRTVGFLHYEIGTEINLMQATNILGKVTTYTYDNSKLVGSLLTSVTYPQGNAGSSQVYDNDGRVIQQQRGTNITRFTYNTNTVTTYVTNAAGNLSAYVHSPSGHFLALTDAGNKVIAITTNALGKRAGLTDRTGASVSVGYNASSGQPNAVTNADGTVTSFTYTNRTINGIVFYEINSVTLPDGSSQNYTYDASGNLTSFADAGGKLTRMTYNNRGQVIGITNATGGVMTMTYNADGTLASENNAESGSITFSHDSLRRATNAIAADGRSIGVTFDAASRITSIINERTNTTFFGFDLNNRLVAVTNALGQVVRLNYDGANRITNVTDRLGRGIGFGFNALDQLVAITNRNGNVIQYTWDVRQRLTSVIDGGNKTWGFGYDDEGLATSVSNPLGQTTSFLRDKAGFISAITNALGRTTLFDRDSMHRVVSTIDPLARLDQFKYEPRSLLTNTTFSAIGVSSNQFNDFGLLTKLVDQRGSAWTFSYSSLGRLTNFADPLNRITSTTYDSRGRPLRLLFPDGSSETNTYDAAGNLSRLDFSGGLSSSFSHDALHRVTNATALGFSFDAEDRVTNTVSSSINFGAAYDPGSRLTNVTYNNGAFSVAYTYDSRDRLVQVRDTLANAQMNFFYDDAGRLTNVTRANGVAGIYNYNAVGRLTRIREGALIDLQYAYDGAGLVSSINASAPLSAAPSSGLTNNLTFDAAQQINAAGYSYDARGRLTNAPGHSFGWNAASQLVRTDGVTNTYNGAGNVLTRATSTNNIRYHYNHAIGRVPIVAEQNASNNQFQRYYVWSPGGKLLYMIDAANGNAVYYYHFDLSGSTLALTSSAGAVTDAYAYSPYGLLAARTGTSQQPFTYIGRHGVRWDSVAGLYHMRARFYDPGTGRFISRDPLWPTAADPLSLNPYSYAANNPLQYVDPMGTKSEMDVPMPIQVLGREEVSRFPTGNSLDDLLNLPQANGNSLNQAPVNLRGLGANNTLVLVDGKRIPGDGQTDVNSIPDSEIDRIEVIKGSSSVYGSDAISGVVNVITKKQETEFHYADLKIGYSFEPKLTYPSLDLAPADGPPAPPPPQPTRANVQIMMYQMVPEMMIMAAYGISIQRAPDVRLGGSAAQEMVQVALLLSGRPHMLQPRGAAFVNGQMVKAKQLDLLYGCFLKEDFYDYLDYWDIDPDYVYGEFLKSLMMGGSGGVVADYTGYRAIAIPPLF